MQRKKIEFDLIQPIQDANDSGNIEVAESLEEEAIAPEIKNVEGPRQVPLSVAQHISELMLDVIDEADKIDEEKSSFFAPVNKNITQSLSYSN